MGPKAETYTFIQVKELQQMHENTLLNVFDSTVDRLDKKIDILGRKLKNQEGIDRSEGKCPIPHWQC